LRPPQWRWLRRAAIAFHANIPRFAGGLIGDVTLPRPHRVDLARDG
jgi:hypothetical protein